MISSDTVDELRLLSITVAARVSILSAPSSASALRICTVSYLKHPEQQDGKARRATFPYWWPTVNS